MVDDPGKLGGYMALTPEEIERTLADLERSAKMITACWDEVVKAFADAWREIEPILAELAVIMAEWRDTLLAIWGHWWDDLPAEFKTMIAANGYDPIPILAEGDAERAYREYARRYNARHPGRRVCWRRLPRPDRQLAALAWLGR